MKEAFDTHQLDKTLLMLDAYLSRDTAAIATTTLRVCVYAVIAMIQG